MKRVLKIVGIVVVVLILIVIALPFLINVNTFRPKLEGDLSTAYDPAFSKAPFVLAKSLKVGVELLPLILSKQIHVTHLTLEQPEMVLLKSSAGKWNFSSLGKNAHGAAAPGAPARAPANAPAPAQKPAESTGAAAKPGEPITQNLSVA